MTDHMPLQEDAELVEQVLQGNREAFGVLVERYTPMVKGIVIRSTPPDHAPDVMQEVFLQAFQSLPSLRTPEKFKSWLYGTAFRVTKHFMRREGIRRTDPLEAHPAPIDSAARPEQVVLSQELHIHIERAFTILPERQAVAVSLYVQGLSYQAIGEQMGVGRIVVHGLLRRGLSTLRKELKSWL